MKKRIAILEDDPDYREILTKLLENEGFEVFVAPTGFEIVNEIVRKQPDLILLDLMLPELSGEKVIDLFKTKEVIKDIPVIIISAKDKSEIKKAAKEIKAVAYFIKPVDTRILLEGIKKYLDR